MNYDDTWENNKMNWVGYMWIPKYEFLKMQKSLFLQFLSWTLSISVGNQSLSQDNSLEQIIGLKKGYENENCIFSV